MKYTVKKILSLVLAAAMILSVAAIAFAAPKAGTLTIRTEITAEDGSDRVENGDTVRVRVFIGTEYATNSGSLLLCYDADFFEAEYTEDALLTMTSNENYPSLSGMDITAAFHSENGKAVNRMITDGNITQADAEKYRFVKISYTFPVGAGNAKLDADEWITEFELKVRADAPEKESTVKAVNSALMTPETPKGLINIPVGEDGGYVGDVASLSEYEVDFVNEGATVNNYKEHTVTFNVNGGTAIEPIKAYTGETVTLPTAEREGFTFVYWTGGGFYQAGYQFTMPAKDVTLTATWLVNSHELRYSVGGEDFVYEVAAGDALPEPDLSGIEGLEILGWLDENGNETELPAKMPDKSVSFTAVVKYNFGAEGGITADFDGGIFGGNENSITFIAESEAFTAESGGVDIGGENHKQIARIEIGFRNNDVSVNPSDGKATISIPVPEKYSGRTDFVIMLDGRQVDFTVADGRIVFSSSEFGVFDIYVKSGTKIKTLPAKTNYFYKESLDISGLELEITAENGEKITVTDTSKMNVTGFNPKKTGSQKLTVEYDGTSATFNVTVSYAWWQTIIRILLLGFLWY